MIEIRLTILPGASEHKRSLLGQMLEVTLMRSYTQNCSTVEYTKQADGRNEKNIKENMFRVI
jgi:hypothetical protein